MSRITVVCLLLVSLTSFAGTPDQPPLATGTVGADCNMAVMFGLRLFLPNGMFAHLLYYGADYSYNGWKPPLHQKMEFAGDLYPDPKQPGAEPIQAASVTFDSFDSKQAEGSYRLTLKDGSIQEGRFKVKHPKLTKHSFCA